MKVKVVSIFRDKYTHKLYNPGEVIEIVDESRVKDLASRNLAECIETPEEKKEVKISLFEQEFEKKALVEVLKAVGVQASGNMKEETLLAKVSELDKESIAKLKVTLGIEA